MLVYIYAKVMASNKICTKCQSMVYYSSAPIGQRHNRCFCLTSVSLTFVMYIGPKSRTERHRKTKIGTEVAHVTRDSDTTFKVKRLKVNLLLMS